MNLDHLLYPRSLFLTALLASPALAAKPKNAILLSDVQSITLYTGKKTTHRRVPAIAQLRCVSSRRLCDLVPDITMRCTNQGAGYSDQDIQWSCAASLPSTLKLGSTEVICEGYSSADDLYVLRGSCGVEYRVALTEEGERRYPDLAGWGSFGDGVPSWGGYLFGLVFVAIVVWIIWGACAAYRRNNNNQPRRNGGGGGWFGGGGPGGGGGGGRRPYDDPPPPYPGFGPFGWSRKNYWRNTSSDNEDWRPGFWSGLAGGAAAGYLAGNRGRQNNTDPRHYTARTNYGSTWPLGNGWQSAAPGSSSSSTGSERQYESTGFGGTSRR